MTGVLVDSSVLLDIFTHDKTWYDWSSTQLEYYADKHTLYINTVIYAEISIGFNTIEELEEALPVDFFKRAAIPWEAAFLAGKVFLRYKKSQGNKTLPLPDFFIGAHAAISNLMLLTRDTHRFKNYFPQLKIITP